MFSVMEAPMAGRAHLPPIERRVVSRLHLLLSQRGLLHGSLHEIARRCGKPGCACAEGQAHPALLLRVLSEGRQRSVYVPAAWEGRVREWIECDRQVRRLLLQISDFYVVRLRERRR
jgi:hypothetical protein